MAKLSEMLERMRTTRSQVQGHLAGITDEQMLAPATWGQREVNVRFFLYRLIAHEVEHTVHLVKVLHALGRAQSEAQLILGRLQTARGELEGLLVGLSDEELDRVPVEGEEWSPRQVLEHIVEGEESYARRVEQALTAVATSKP